MDGSFPAKIPHLKVQEKQAPTTQTKMPEMPAPFDCQNANKTTSNIGSHSPNMEK